MNLKKLKKVDLRKPKYILPLVILLPLLGLIYYLMAFLLARGTPLLRVWLQIPST